MRETRTSGLMSGDGKRGDANLAQATAPVLDSTRKVDSYGLFFTIGDAQHRNGFLVWQLAPM